MADGTLENRATPPDDFYIGYLPVAPDSIGRSARRAALILVGGAALLGGILATRQQRVDVGVFEYGIERRLEGTILESPYPTLLVARPGLTDRTLAYSRYYLVASGKHGAQQITKGLNGAEASLQGSLIHRGGQTMFEVHAVTPTAAEAVLLDSLHRTADLGPATLEGEIVDSKCYLGVMRPGEGAVHRGCATRCLSGGAPPLLIVRDSSGPAAFVLLTGTAGEPLPREEMLRYVGVPVSATGELLREGEMVVLRTASVKRIGD